MPKSPKVKAAIPFAFVVEELADIAPEIKSMFGCKSLYIGDRIVLILREKNGEVHDNGVWVATTAEHHASLRRDFPSLRHIKMFGPGPTGWQNLPATSETFEAEALAICAAIRRCDPRIGKVPASRKKKLKPRAKSQK